MPRKKEISREALTALGAEALADVLIAHAGTDPPLRKKLGVMMAATKGAGNLADEIDRQLKTIARARSFLERDKRKALANELDYLRATIASQFADSPRGIALLWDFIALEDWVQGRIGDGVGEMEAIFETAMSDLGRLSAAAREDPHALALRIIAFGDISMGRTSALISHLSDALGVEGRALLREATQAALQAIPARGGVLRFEIESKRREIVMRLAQLADLDHDPDAFIAALRLGGLEAIHRAEIAERLIAADRAAEALDLLSRGASDKGDIASVAALRIEALEALGRKAEALTERWRQFERSLNVDQLREYLKRLPDFEDFDAEQRALDHAAAHPDANRALAFLIAWRALDRADRLTRERTAQFDGRLYDVLRPAAEALEGKFPEAASLLYRRLIESVLERGSPNQYVYAAADLISCADLASRLPSPGTIESHAEFVARLKSAHGRKYMFWNALDFGTT